MENNFERALADKLIKSIQEEPEKWTSSIWGLESKEDGIEIKFSFIGPDVSIYKPKTYEFKDKKIHNELAAVVRKVKLKHLEEIKREEERKAKEELTKILNLDSRKHKLEHLREVSEERYDIDIEEETGEIKESKPWWKFW